MLKMIEKQGKGVMGALLCRTSYIDDVLIDASGKGISQVVILGAGMDSRPYRKMTDRNIVFFEVDYPEVLAFKKKRLKRIYKNLPSSVLYIPIDFNSQTLQDVLTQPHFSLNEKTLFIWEGVTQYITHEAADAVLRFISKSKKGSLLVFTYIVKNFIDHMEMAAEQEEFDGKFQERLKKIWINGYNPDELASYLSTMNLPVMEDIDRKEFKSRYLDPHHRSMNLLSVERIVLAKKDS
jgi:methyltransferase (TIGR00027 family)